MLRKRLIGLLLVLPLVGALAWAAYKFGPGVTSKAEQMEISAMANPAPPEAAGSVPETSQLFKLLGVSEKALASGHVALTPSEYLDSIEQLYQKRGYRKLGVMDLAVKRTRRSIAELKNNSASRKFFQRQESKEMSSISAVGNDADYSSSQQSSEQFTFSTLVVPAENGGSDWATYRVDVDRSKLAQLGNLADGDFPGSDPVNVPRMTGLQRIYALTSERGSICIYRSNESDTDLMLKYVNEMPRYGWRLDDDVTQSASKVASGVMCFTQGSRFCMIWIMRNNATGETNVTISSH